MMDSNPPPHIPFRNPPPKDVEAPRQRIDVAVSLPFIPKCALTQQVSTVSETKNKMFWMVGRSTEMQRMHQGRPCV
jgi:hypothetical protein